jgi:SAM-dependent methyltransferase
MPKTTDLQERINALGKWYHRIDLGGGIVTPGTNNQAITFALYASRFLPSDLSGLTVLDLGANACGLSIEFARRGADVVAIEHGATYAAQAEFVLDRLGLREKVRIIRSDIFSALKLGQEFDIVCYVGLSYHLRHPQLALDMIGWLTKPHGHLLASSQTMDAEGYRMQNRVERYPHERGELFGWEPTEPVFEAMILQAGFDDVTLVSTSPHPGESEGNVAGNRSYFHAIGGKHVALPFMSDVISKPQISATHRR